MKRMFKGHFIIKGFDKDGNLKWIEDIHNMNVDEGLTDILGVYFSGDTQSTSWYILLIGSNSTPTSNWTYTEIGTDFTEFTSYDEATRVAWAEAGASSNAITNSASPATFTASTGVDTTIYGAALVNVSTKGDSGVGKLWCATLFGTARPFAAAEQIQIVYTINSQDV